jgi:signal transduction histidine kinase
MHFAPREWIGKLLKSMAVPPPEAAQQLRRLQVVERDVILPIKLALVVMLVYAFEFSRWFDVMSSTLDLVVEYVKYSIALYAGINVVGAVILLFMERMPLILVQWAVFTVCLVDGVFLAALALVTGGYDSRLYWLFVGLVMRNAASIPPTVTQIILNLSVCLCYMVAGVMDIAVSESVAQNLSPTTREELNVGWSENPAEPILLRLFVLTLTAISGFGVQVLLEKQRLAQEDAREFSIRDAQVRSAGRLAAEIAHQIKNPLAIINNTVFSLRRACAAAAPEAAQQLDIIQEEVNRSDQIITQLMGYAQLAEGRVEKLHLAAELDRALAEVFPAGAGYLTHVQRDYDVHLPSVVMQRGHLSQILVNLLLNAREATAGRGQVHVIARTRPDYSVEIAIRDDGPGIAPDKLERVFEAYYTTKVRGTGLGLAIVKHNVDLYGGSVWVESALGKGARFTLVFPAVTPIKTRHSA